MAELEKARKELNLSQDEVVVDETIAELSNVQQGKEFSHA